MSGTVQAVVRGIRRFKQMESGAAGSSQDQPPQAGKEAVPLCLSAEARSAWRLCPLVPDAEERLLPPAARLSLRLA